MADYTTVGLLAGIRRRASIPATQTTGSADADLLFYANEELQLALTGDIVKVREEYRVVHVDTAISGTTYRINKRAAGGMLRRLCLVDSSDAEVAIARIEPERLDGVSSSDSALGYYLRDNYVILVGTPTEAYLRQVFYLRPSELTATSSNWAAVLSFVAATNTITTSAAHGFTTSSVLDIVAAQPPFDCMAIDQTPTAASGSSITFSSLPVGLAVGDYICVNQLSPVAQVPLEFYPILEQRAANRWMEAGGAAELATGRASLAEMEAKIFPLVTPRVKGSNQKIVNRNAFGGQPFRRRGW